MQNLDLDKFSKLEKEKYLNFLPIISERLNNIHDLKESNSFWEKILGYTLLIHISQCLYIFEKCENLFSKKQIHTDEITINPPRNELSYKNIFYLSDRGKKILEYIFFNDTINTKIGKKFELKTYNSIKKVSFFSKIKTKGFFQSLKHICILFFNKLIKPKVLIYQSWWSDSEKQNIQLSSFFKVQFSFDNFSFNAKNVPTVSKRDILSSLENLDDNFDRFFFKSLKYSMPGTLIEDFKFRNQKAIKLLNSKKVKHFFNESLSEDALLLLAHAEKQSIRTHYIEHNYLQHQFKGNAIWFIKRKFDYYLSIGWEDNKDLNHIPCSSNYDWSFIKRKNKKNIDILFISALAQRNYPHFSAGYGECGDTNSELYIKMKKIFLKALHKNILEKIYYKDYPDEKKINFTSEHPLNVKLNSELKKYPFKFDNKDKIGMNYLIERSKILICDYLSTPYNTALLSNVPTLILFNSKSYQLKKKYSNFYNPLIEANIMFKDPLKAAIFLNANFYSIEDWWNSRLVQNNLAEYIKSNFGEKGALSKHIMSKLN